MKIESIIKKLDKDGELVYIGQFDFKECWMCRGTALIDLEDGIAKPTNAKYLDVVKQIEDNRSHIYTIEDGKKGLTNNLKLQGKESYE